MTNPLATLPSNNKRSFTLTEVLIYSEIKKELGTKVYFACPYCSWQSGTNENTDGLIRQYFPLLPLMTVFSLLFSKLIIVPERILDLNLLLKFLLLNGVHLD